MYSEEAIFQIPASSKTRPKDQTKSAKWYQHWWGRLVIIFLVIFLVVLIAVIFYFVKVVTMLKSGEITPNQLLGGQYNKQFNAAILASDSSPNLGPKDAKIIIVEFADFQCSASSEVYPVIKEVLANHGNQILFVYKNFPLVNDNPLSLITALAGQCAYEQGKFWEMEEKLFNNQDNITDASLKTFAVQIGLNSLQFNNCLQTEKYLSQIEKDLQDGYALGVRATPTFFVNGVKFQGAMPLNNFEQIITSVLSH